MRPRIRLLLSLLVCLLPWKVNAAPPPDGTGVDFFPEQWGLQDLILLQQSVTTP